MKRNVTKTSLKGKKFQARLQKMLTTDGKWYSRKNMHIGQAHFINIQFFQPFGLFEIL